MWRLVLVVGFLLVGFVAGEITYVYPPQGTGLECKLDNQGTYYDGQVKNAIDGSACLPWSTIPEFANNTDLGNFCRGLLVNGTAVMPYGPWCYTGHNRTAYCNITMCAQAVPKYTRECLKTNGFMSYAGKANASVECLPWITDQILALGFYLWMFPGSDSWISMSNYCRNPDNDKTIWCYSTAAFKVDGNLVKVYCENVTACSTKCRTTEGSLEYIGEQNVSGTKKPCLKAQDMIPKIFSKESERKKYFEARYVNDNYAVDLYSCRSYPGQLQYGVNELGPVCYVNNTGSIQEETCSIHYCRPADIENDMFYTTGIQFETSTTAKPTKPPINLSSYSVEDHPAFQELEDFTYSHQTVESPESTKIGVAIYTTFFFCMIFLLIFDCLTSKKCQPYLSSSKKKSGGLDDLYGSRMTLRSNRITDISAVSKKAD